MKNKFLFSTILSAGILTVGFSTYVINAQTTQKEVVAHKMVKYTCPMHPEIVMNYPGECPKCGMELVEKKAEKAETSTLSGDMNVLFKNSCMDCHGTEGNKFEKNMLDFTKWDQYKPDKQAKKAAAICRRVSKNTMPPKTYLKAKPKATLSEAQKDSICNWSRGFAARK